MLLSTDQYNNFVLMLICNFLVVLGEAANFAAYAFAPAILVTPLGALSIIFRYAASFCCTGIIQICFYPFLFYLVYLRQSSFMCSIYSYGATFF